jgi:hypothetical protein
MSATGQFLLSLDNQWAVAEAKGRSNGMESSLPASILAQKGAVATVSGQVPTVTFGCVTSFPRLPFGARGPMRLDAIDPEPDARGTDWDVEEARFLTAYYEPIVGAIRQDPDHRDEDGLTVANFPALGLRLGLSSRIYRALVLARGETVDFENLSEVIAVDTATRQRATQDQGERVLSPDMVFVETTWDLRARPDDVVE